MDINGIEGGNASVTVNGVSYNVELDAAADQAGQAAESAATGLAANSSGSIGVDASGIGQSAPSAAAAGQPAPGAGAAGASSGAGTVVHSPLPGVIISVDVKEGQAVKKGQKVAVLEAMKMENEIQADVDGTVTAILVNKGDSVLEGADILKIA